MGGWDDELGEEPMGGGAYGGGAYGGNLLKAASSTCTLTANPISWTTSPMTHLKEAFGPASLGCAQIEVCDGKQIA